MTAHKIGMTAHKIGMTAHKIGMTAHKIVMTAHKIGMTAHKIGMTAHKIGMTAHKLEIKTFILFLLTSTLTAQPVPGSYYDFIDATKNLPAGHDKTSLIIYRPDNVGVLNDIRCFLRIENEAGEDVTYDKKTITATYEWVSIPDRANNYKKKYYLSGGMAMHLKLKKGRYKISLYTPVDQQNNFVYAEADAKPFQWESNIFEYNTENPTKVIFVTPTRNDNGFYNGGWKIDYKDSNAN